VVELNGAIHLELVGCPLDIPIDESRIEYWNPGMYLGETDVGSLLTEALTADVEAVLADKTGLVGADTATISEKVLLVSILPVDCVPFLAFQNSPLSSILPPPYAHRTQGGFLPLTRALAVLARAGEPNGFVRHVD
jgi:hypothetical protein